jgi:AcrR family transcriptional regulator
VTKSDDRRSQLLAQLTDYVLDHGLSAASLRPLARAAQISDRMLLYYFTDKATVIAAILDRIAERLMDLLCAKGLDTPLPADVLRTRLLDILCADDLWPYMRLWLELAAQAAKGDMLYRTVGEQIARGFLAFAAARIEAATAAQREAHAARLLVSVEGVLLLKSVGLEGLSRRAIDGLCPAHP